MADGPHGVDSHLKAYERAQQMLQDLESETMKTRGCSALEQIRLFDAFLGNSSIWQPQPCKENHNNNTNTVNPKPIREKYGDENVNLTNKQSHHQPNAQRSLFKPATVAPPWANNLNINAPPFYATNLVNNSSSNQLNETLKRTRSMNAGTGSYCVGAGKVECAKQSNNNNVNVSVISNRINNVQEIC